MEQTAFLGLMLLGIVALVGGMAYARLCWRREIPAYGRSTRTWDVLFHPERYAEAHAVRTIRALFLMGLIGIVGGVVVLAHKAVHDLGGVVGW